MTVLRSSGSTGTRGHTRRWPPHHNCRRSRVEEEVDVVEELGGVDSVVPGLRGRCRIRQSPVPVDEDRGGLVARVMSMRSSGFTALTKAATQAATRPCTNAREAFLFSQEFRRTRIGRRARKVPPRKRRGSGGGARRGTAVTRAREVQQPWTARGRAARASAGHDTEDGWRRRAAERTRARQRR